MLKSKGVVKVKNKISGEGVRCGEDSLYIGYELVVVDIAVDGEGYLVLNKEGSGLGDIPKKDTEWFKPAGPDIMELLTNHLRK